MSHKAAYFEKANTNLIIGTIPTPEPNTGEVLVKVTASSICHSDILSQNGGWPGTIYPLVPGHEVIGRISKVGDGVDQTIWKEGDHVGAGWQGYNCNQCNFCRKGDFAGCANKKVTGINMHGGHQEYVILPISALVRIPETDIPDANLAPILCAGITVYEALKKSDYTPGDLALVSGIGGLGHLALQFAAKLGLYTVAVSTSLKKADQAIAFGAREVWTASEAVERAKAQGGAKVIICTATNKSAIEGVLPAAGRGANILFLGFPDDGAPIAVDTFHLVPNRITIKGWSCGSASDNEETLKFAVLNNVTAKVKTFKLEQIQEAFEDTMHGRPEFRNVIVFD